MDGELYQLVPGSPPARSHGCICEAQEATIVEEPDGRTFSHYRCDPACPVHGLAVMHTLFHDTAG